MSILIVDDEEVSLNTFRMILRRRGYADVEVCDNGERAIERIKQKDFDLVLLDLLMPGVDGLQVLEKTKPFKPGTEFIILTAVDDVATAVKAVRLGAYDYLVKPVDNERLILTVARAFERRGLLISRNPAVSESRQTEIRQAFFDTITRCPRMEELLAHAVVMAASGNPILITGESGTGKELVARGIHRAGPSPEGPFMAVNLSSIPETMFESQIFGHAKGAFTGAEKSHPGFFEQADGGTLFLDEIGEIPMNLQVKLLRVLEEKKVIRLGETKPIAVDVRIVSATNQDLETACREGRFRLDLMYRLNSTHIHLPPLRERKRDVPLLAERFLGKAAERFGKPVKGFSREAMDMLETRPFPGNVRELAQLVENAVLVSESSMITPGDLGGPTRPEAQTFEPESGSLKEAVEAHIERVLRQTGGNRTEAARILQLSVRQLRRRLAQMKESPRWREVLDSPE